MEVLRKKISSVENSMLCMCGVGVLGEIGAVIWSIKGGQCGGGRPELHERLCPASWSRLNVGCIPSALRNH